MLIAIVSLGDVLAGVIYFSATPSSSFQNFHNGQIAFNNKKSLKT
jgi:hypothetical protein